MFKFKLVSFILFSLLLNQSYADNPADKGCKTTDECLAQVAKAGMTSLKGDEFTSENDKKEDQFYWLQKINKASAVMLKEEKIISSELAKKLAEGIVYTNEQSMQPNGKRPKDVLQIEKIIQDNIGPDASFIHTGRSRQDMYSTYRMAKLRNQSLDYAETLLKLRASILNLASQHIHTIVPAYTNGVQAMPQSYAHYLLAFNASFARDQERFISLYQRMNKTSMGTAVLANSSWPLNRQRLAELLGFDDPIENSYDASQIAPSDIAIEASNLPASTAIRLGMLLNDIHTQYHQVTPWILLDENSTYTSSAMPQKRNPGVIMRARESASNVLGLAQAVSIRNHNVTPGMTDYKSAWEDLNLFPETMTMLRNTLVVIQALKINPEQSLEELENDWTTSMELAETLQKDFSIPFRVGHHFASTIVTTARNNGWRPSEFPFEKAKTLYIEAIEKFKLSSPELPLSEQAFRQTLSPKHMVETRVGLGGPQATEVERMLKEAKDKLSADIQWIQQTRQKLNAADKNLEQAFNSLM